jgi:hypothetical protein
MITRFMVPLLAVFSLAAFTSTASAQPAVVKITGELKQWHKVTLTFDGPPASETDSDPNPFLDYRMTAIFRTPSGNRAYLVPGYFAADGDAANTQATSGNKWRAHFSPDKPGKWAYCIWFVKGKNRAVEPYAPQELTGCQGVEGSFTVSPTDKAGRDFRGKGTLRYVGKHYLQFAGTGEYFLKAGADAPENLLAYTDFDGTFSRRNPDAPVRPGEAAPSGLHSWGKHAGDWKPGDPTWAGGKGKNLIGALNYLAGKGANAFSFLTYNVGGDGDDVWPFAGPEDKLHYNCSKLDQWQIIFDHAQKLGLYLHFKMEETENDDNRKDNQTVVPAALDGGDLGVERKLYCRELIARFGYELALNWNLGEENTLSAEQQRAMAKYIQDLDPYGHNIVVHTFPDWQDRVYSKLLGSQSVLTGASLQNNWDKTHQRTLEWVSESTKSGRPWVVANDEQGPSDLGVPPDPGYQGFDGKARQKDGNIYDINDIRKYTLWGNLMAGGAGVEYYFGYTLPQNDLKCEDWRSRDQSWDFARLALSFFSDNKIPFWEMRNADTLVGNPASDNSRYCLAKPGDTYVVYLPNGGSCELDLSGESGGFDVKWFNPRKGGVLDSGSVRQVKGGTRVSLGPPPAEPTQDWCVLVRR